MEAAAGQLQSLADLADAAAGLMLELQDHRSGLDGGAVPRVTATFFKMSFSMSSRAYCLRRRRSQCPAVKDAGADAKLLGHIGRDPAQVEQLHGTGLELIAVWFPDHASHTAYSLNSVVQYFSSPQNFSKWYRAVHKNCAMMNYMAIIKRAKFTRRVTDHVTDGLVSILLDGRSHEFKPLFTKVYETLKLKNAVSGGEEMLRLRCYEKLLSLANRGLVKKTGKSYLGLKGMEVATSLQRFALIDANVAAAAV